MCERSQTPKTCITLLPTLLTGAVSRSMSVRRMGIPSPHAATTTVPYVYALTITSLTSDLLRIGSGLFSLDQDILTPHFRQFTR